MEIETQTDELTGRVRRIVLTGSTAVDDLFLTKASAIIRDGQARIIATDGLGMREAVCEITSVLYKDESGEDDD